MLVYHFYHIKVTHNQNNIFKVSSIVSANLNHLFRNRLAATVRQPPAYMDENEGPGEKSSELIGTSCEKLDYALQTNIESWLQQLDATFRCLPGFVPFGHLLLQCPVSTNQFAESYLSTSLSCQTSKHDQEGQRRNDFGNVFVFK